MNGSSSNNQTEEYVVPYSVEMKIGYSMAYLAILLVAVSGNSFVIHVARKLLSAGRGPFNILVINMAASDILYAFTVVSLNLKYLYNGNLWFPGEFGAFLCKFSGFALVFSISYSILSLIAMTVDRYLAIVPDVKKPLTRKTVLKVIFAVLVSSFGWSSFNFFKLDTASDVYPEEKLTFCYFVYSGDKYVDEKLLKVEYTLSFIFLYVFPVAVMSVLYSLLFGFYGYGKYQETELTRMKPKGENIFKKSHVCWLLWQHLLPLLGFQHISCITTGRMTISADYPRFCPVSSSGRLTLIVQPTRVFTSSLTKSIETSSDAYSLLL